MKKIIIKFGAWAATLPILLSGSNVFAGAHDKSSLGNVQAIGKKLNTQSNLPEYIGGIIKVFMSTLGLIFILLVVYAGYMYLTAAGDDEKVKKAKKLLGQAVIGIIIVLAAFAVTEFVVSGLQSTATTATTATK